MASDWRPANSTKQLHTQVVFDDQQIRFRFQWDQPDPGGWLTTHEGMRSLPSAASPEAVQTYPHHGSEALDRTDIRKYIPQACAGEWWPLGYGTDYHVLDYRHSDQGQNMYGTQEWDPDEGPVYMCDPVFVADGAIEYHAVRNGDLPPQGSGTYALKPDERVPFYPAVAEWEER